MNEKELVKLSKRMSKWLRHDPGNIGLVLDPAGWVGVEDLIGRARAHGHRFTRTELDRVVAENNKQRFEFDQGGNRIRARQGHTVAVELGYAAAEPPAELYHGTAESSAGMILREGIRAMTRHAVHLSQDLDTARKVGGRHGKPVILIVDAAAMHAAGHVFQVTGNGVWLVESVPPEFLRRDEAVAPSSAGAARRGLS